MTFACTCCDPNDNALGDLMIRGSVYLAGPISGLTFQRATNWRATAARDLGKLGIACFSPLRGKAGFLHGEESIPSVMSDDVHPLATNRGIMARDRFDVMRADVILAYLHGAQRVSIGTVMEVAWANMAHKPVIAVMEPGNVHEHAMMNEAISYRVEDLDGAVELVRSILHPGVL